MAKSIFTYAKSKAGNPSHDAIKEIDAAGVNLGVVSQAASRLHHDPDLSGLDISPVTNLVRSLVQVIEETRGIITADGAAAPEPAPEGPNYGSEALDYLETLDCLCPLTVLLRLIADHLAATDSTGSPGTDSAMSKVWTEMKTIGAGLTKKGEEAGKAGFWPGVAQCIILCDEGKGVKVFSTTPRYTRLKGLGNFARRRRNTYHERLFNNCDKDAQCHIRQMKTFSTAVRSHVRDEASNENPFADERHRMVIRGHYVSLDPTGTKKPPCLLDQFRLKDQEPPALPLADGKNTRVANATTCAEWEAWLYQRRSSRPRAEKDPQIGA